MPGPTRPPVLPSEIMTAPFTDEALDAALRAEADGEGTEHDATLRWRPDDDPAAEWVARRWRERLAEAAEVRAMAKGYRAEIDAWADGAATPHEQAAARWEALLKDYHERVRETADPKKPRKTVKLPSATLASTARQAAASIEDPDAVVEWAKSVGLADSAVKVTERPIMAGVKAAIVLAKEVEAWTVTLGSAEGGEVILHRGGDADHPPSTDPEEYASYADALGGAVEAVEVAPEWSYVARSADTGQAVPGIVVEPPKVTYRVDPT